MDVYIFIYFFFLASKFLLANSADPDQAPHSPVSEQDRHCLQNTPKGEADLKRVKQSNRNN